MGLGTTGARPAGPRFVERGGEVAYRQPFSAKGVRLYAFFLEADITRLDQWHARSFAEPSGGAVRFRAASSHVVLAFAEIDRLGPCEPPDSMLGVTREVEAAIWAPAFDDDDELVWTMPYVFVDQMAPIAGGREIYGFPKQLGTIAWGSPPDAPPWFCLTASAVRDFAADAVSKTERILSVVRPAAALQADEWAHLETNHHALVSGATEAAATFSTASRGAPFDDALLATRFLANILRGVVPMAFLKQFRSCSEPELACYQAIVKVDLGLCSMKATGPLPNDYRVKLEVLDSEPLVADLGLHEVYDGPPAFWVDFEFVVPTGRVAWEAGSPSA